jgi:anti-sigma factor RsiW
MTCDDARAVLSALIDDALPAGERTACEAHLAACPDCTRELARLRATVSLVRAIGPARAPAGFVDRVVTAARAEPPSRRTARGLLRRAWPLGVPLSAVAAVLVAVVGVSLYRLTPELRQAARHNAAPQTETPPTSASSTPATTAPPATPPSDAARPARETSPERSEGATEPPRGAAPAVVPPTAAAGPSPAPAAPSPRAPDLAAEPERRALSDAVAPREQTAKAAPREEQNAVAQPAPAPSRDRMAAPPLERSVGRTSPVSVEARLVVTSIAGAERAVADVVSRLQARLETRTEVPDGARLAIDVPGGAYAELARALSEIGSFTVLGEPATTAEPIHLNLRITR